MSEPQGYTQAFVDVMNSKLAQDITKAFESGAQVERERIIKLLKPRLAQMGSDHCMCHTIGASAIRLIKGENK